MLIRINKQNVEQKKIKNKIKPKENSQEERKKEMKKRTKLMIDFNAQKISSIKLVLTVVFLRVN